MSELTSNMGSTQKIGQPPNWPSSTENEGHDHLEQHSNGEISETHGNQQNDLNGEHTGHLITDENKLSGLQNGTSETNQNGGETLENSREHTIREQSDGLGEPELMEVDQDLSESTGKHVANSPKDPLIVADNLQADQIQSEDASEEILESKNITDETENAEMDYQEPATIPPSIHKNLPIVGGTSSEESETINGSGIDLHGNSTDSQNVSTVADSGSHIPSGVSSEDVDMPSQTTDGSESIQTEMPTNLVNTAENDAPVPIENLGNERILQEQALEEESIPSELQDGNEKAPCSETSPVTTDIAGDQKRLTEDSEKSPENPGDSSETFATNIGDETPVTEKDFEESIAEHIPDDPVASNVVDENGSEEAAVTDPNVDVNENSVPNVDENENSVVLPNDDNNENQPNLPNQARYVERNFGQEEEANLTANRQNHEPEEQLLQGGRVPLRDISETMEHHEVHQQDEDDQDTDEQSGGNRRNQVADDGNCFSHRPIGPRNARYIPIAPRPRRPEDDIPGPSSYYPPERRRRPEDDIPGPSNPQPRKIATWLLQNANVKRHHGIRRDPRDDIPGPSHSSPVYSGNPDDDDMPNTSDSYQDEPIVGEELAQLLRIANVSRFQAGLPPAQKTPPYEYVTYGGSPSPTNDGPSTSGPSTSGPSSSNEPSTSQNSAYIDADFEYAKRLQEEENRRVRFEDDNQQSSSGSQPYNPWVPSRYQSDGNEGDNEGEGDREIKISPHLSTEDAYLHGECGRLYTICRSRVPDVYVPEPMSIPNMHPFQFIAGYRDVINGGVFTFPDTSEPPVPPGSPGPSEDVYRSTTVTTAYQVVMGPNGEKSLKKKLTLKIPRNVAFPVAKRQLKMDGGSSRKQAFQAESFPIGDSANRPTAFQKFVKATDAALSRVPTKPLFSDDHYDEPGVPGPGPSSRESQRKHLEYMHRKRRLEALIDIESGEPGITSRRIETVSEEDDGMGDDMNDADDEPFEKGTDGVFAVPAVPLRVGKVPSSEDNNSFYETSPAGQRRIYQQRRKRIEKPRLSLQMPLNDHGEGTSSSGGHSSRSPNRKSGGSSVFSQDLMNRHAFLRRTDDEDSIFNTGTMSHLNVDCGNEPVATNTVATQAAESNYPNIPWKDPENMPAIDEIPDAELRKMPAEYVDAIVESQIGDEAEYRRENQYVDEKKKALEASYLQICRSYIQTPCRVPHEVLNTRFEIYIRFPFFQRPLYVQNVLVALEIPDNEGNVLARVPEKYLSMSFAEFFKEGVKALFGLRLTDTPTTKAISQEQLEDSIMKYLQEVSSRWYSEVPSLPYDKQVDRENEIHDQMDSLEATPISNSDLAEMERYRLHFLEEQKLSAQRQRMKVVGNSLSRFVPRNPAINRVRLADVVEVDDSVDTGVVRQPDRQIRLDAEREEGEINSDDDELTETQL